MIPITEGIKNTDNAICRYLDQVDNASCGVISQDIRLPRKLILSRQMPIKEI